MERDPGMSLRAGDSTAGVQMDSINNENMKKYFDLLEEVYTVNRISTTILGEL